MSINDKCCQHIMVLLLSCTTRVRYVLHTAMRSVIVHSVVIVAQRHC
jgi:hypothetical protein